MNADNIFVVIAMQDGNVFDRLQGNVAKKKFEKALEMLRNENPQELKKKLNQMDTGDILSKMDEYDAKKLNQMGINLDEIRQRITDKDFEKLTQLLGSDGAVIAQRLRNLLKNGR